MLVGAYQETMGDLHNCFGRVHEAEVLLGADGQPEVRRVWAGESAADALKRFGYEEEWLVGRIQAGLDERVEHGKLSREESEGLLSDYRERLRHYTYLD